MLKASHQDTATQHRSWYHTFQEAVHSIGLFNPLAVVVSGTPMSMQVATFLTPSTLQAQTMGRRSLLAALQHCRARALQSFCTASFPQKERLMFRYLRNMDRRKHLADYPKLTFPHMYVLKGGYQTFHELFPAMCNPQHAYVRMHDAVHLEDHKACRKVVKAAWDQKAACNRSFV